MQQAASKSMYHYTLKCTKNKAKVYKEQSYISTLYGLFNTPSGDPPMCLQTDKNTCRLDGYRFPPDAMIIRG